MKRLLGSVAVVLGVTMLTLGVVSGPVDSASGATAVLKDAAGNPAGSVRLAASGADRVIVQAVLTGGSSLAPGFHGFHIHTTGSCVPPSFTSTGGHLGRSRSQFHDDHLGDMPPLLVNRDHTALLTFETDRALLDRVLDADGSAVVVHADADNFANIPARYGGPDFTTLTSGDAGDRILCGELR